MSGAALSAPAAGQELPVNIVIIVPDIDSSVFMTVDCKQCYPSIYSDDTIIFRRLDSDWKAVEKQDCRNTA